MKSGSSWDALEAEGLEEEEGRSGKRGVKKAWRERRDSRTNWGGEVGETKERSLGRLLTWALEERRSWPRVLRSESFVLLCFCFCFLERMEAMVAAAGKVKVRRERN